MTHCFDVLRVAGRLGVLDAVTGPAAVRHDVLEDCPGVTFDELVDVIDQPAATVARDLSFHVDPADPQFKAEQKVAHLAGLAKRSVEVVTLKPCDRYCSVTDFLATRPERAESYLREGDPIFAAVDTPRTEMGRRWGTGTAGRLPHLQVDARALVGAAGVNRR